MVHGRCRRLGALLLACALVGLAACGGDDNSGQSKPGGTSGAAPEGAKTPKSREPTTKPFGGASAIDACDLVRAADAEQALGAPVDDAKRESIAQGFSRCIYRIRGGTEIDAAVFVHARGNTSRDKFEELVKENAPPEVGETVPLDGLGDVAYEGPIGTYVLQGDTMVTVTVNSGQDDDSAKQRELARKALQRIP